MYAIKIRKSDLPFLALLNGGVEPKIEKRTTYLVIDTDGPNRIVGERELLGFGEISARSPLLLKFKKQ